MSGDQLADDRQPDPGAGDRGSALAIEAIITSPYSLTIDPRDTRPLVGDPDLHAIWMLAHRDPNLLTLWTVFDGIVQQVQQNLAQRIVVDERGGFRIKLGLHGGTGRICEWLELVHDAYDERRQKAVDGVQFTLIALSIGKSQYVFDQVNEPLRLAIDNLQCATLVVGRAEALMKQGFAKHAYLSQWRTQLMRNLGHKIGPDFYQRMFALQLAYCRNKQSNRQQYHREQDR